LINRLPFDIFDDNSDANNELIEPVIQFEQVEQECQEDCDCVLCELIEDALECISLSEDGEEEELESQLAFFIHEAYRIGYQNALRDDIEMKIALVNQLNEPEDL
jgi:hypothetical protein